MRHATRPLLLVTILAGLAAAGCGGSSAFDNGAASDVGPSRVEAVKGSPYAHVILTAQAAQRIGIQMAPIRAERLTRSRRTREVIPYAAVLYDAHGHAYTYASPARLVFVRRPISIARIDGDRAILRKGPPAGTPVVTVGAAELYGVEYGVEED